MPNRPEDCCGPKKRDTLFRKQKPDSLAGDVLIDAENNYSFNNFVWCYQEKMLPQRHTLTVYAHVPRENQTFWFDWMDYTPVAGASLENKTISIAKEDPDIKYFLEWIHNPNWSGSNLRVRRKALELVWRSNSFGYGEYLYDRILLGGWPTIYHIQRKLLPSKRSKLSAVFLNATLPMGNHNLSVTYNGDDQTVPLSLDFLFIQNGTITSSPTNNTPLPSIISAGTKQNTTSLLTRIAIIVASVAGVLFVHFVVLCFVYRRARSRRRDIENHKEHQNQPTYTVEAFDYRSIPQSSPPPPSSYRPSPFLTWYSSSHPHSSEDVAFLQTNVDESMGHMALASPIYAGIVHPKSGDATLLSTSEVPARADCALAPKLGPMPESEQAAIPKFEEYNDASNLRRTPKTRRWTTRRWS
ncbi:hypothetical protein CPB83DRAFT_949669 [Crepidotus variabilis]|uniref:Uncharacterized protein n=1 Tax=Crepidotus variabilis TaxID=179855 RepID=A0A9P6E737_9AGAR|nr:hypothetical protein CPB83DRAFT_949669 [Crepidotus variabilis]